MLAFAQAYRARDQNAVQQLLGTPIFIAPRNEIEARLNEVPLITVVNVATEGADVHAFGFSSPMRIMK